MRIVAGLEMIAVVAGLAGTVVLPAAAAVAQAPSSPAALATATASSAASAAFEALPEAERRAVQDALVWTGDYKGVVDGHFGTGTRDAIVAFAKRAHLPADGTLGDKARASLIATAAKAKEAVAFTLTSDPRSGVRIGVPLKLLPKTTDAKTGTRYAAADGAATLETVASTAGEADLSATFDRLTADAPGHHVTYKILRPDFLVVSGTTAGGTFYTRMARGAVNDAAELRGYTLTYPNALKPQFDVIAIAIANAFEPFPAPAAAPAAPSRSAPLVASALADGADLALSILPPGACTDLQVAGHQGRISRQDAGSSLVLLDVPGLQVPGSTARPLPPFAAAPVSGTPVVVLFETAAAAGAVPPASGLFATAGELLAPPAGAANAAITAPLQAPATGAVVFDRTGALVGLVAAVPQMPRLVAGIAPRSTYSIVLATALAGFLGSAERPLQSVATAAQIAVTAAAIAAAAGTSIVPVTCGP